MRGDNIGRAPDYTVPALTMLGVNLICFFVIVWAIWGFLATLALALALNHGITLLSRRPR